MKEMEKSKFRSRNEELLKEIHKFVNSNKAGGENGLTPGRAEYSHGTGFERSSTIRSGAP